MHLPPHGLHDMEWHDAYGKNPISTPIGKFLLQCVCGGVRGTRMYVQMCANLESPLIMENWGVIKHLCLMNFILLRHIKMVWTRDGFGG